MSEAKNSNIENPLIWLREKVRDLYNRSRERQSLELFQRTDAGEHILNVIRDAPVDLNGTSFESIQKDYLARKLEKPVLEQWVQAYYFAYSALLASFPAPGKTIEFTGSRLYRGITGTDSVFVYDSANNRASLPIKYFINQLKQKFCIDPSDNVIRDRLISLNSK